MSYLRPIRLSELKEFLEQNQDLNALDLAQKLVDRFDILTYSMEQK